MFPRLVRTSKPIAAALTQHELELLSLLAAGHSFRQMAALQGMAVSVR
jgi:DNA-binding CsgD family transcriptional regulator